MLKKNQTSYNLRFFPSLPRTIEQCLTKTVRIKIYNILVHVDFLNPLIYYENDVNPNFYDFFTTVFEQNGVQRPMFAPVSQANKGKVRIILCGSLSFVYHTRCRRCCSLVSYRFKMISHIQIFSLTMQSLTKLILATFLQSI